MATIERTEAEVFAIAISVAASGFRRKIFLKRQIRDFARYQWGFADWAKAFSRRNGSTLIFDDGSAYCILTQEVMHIID